MYSNKQVSLSAPIVAETVLTSAATIGSFLVPSKCDVLQIALSVTTLTSTSSSIVVTVYDRPIYGSSSGQVAIGTLTIPTAAAAGAVYYKAVQYAITAGHYVDFVVTTVASSAGKGNPMVIFGNSAEDERNQTSYVASA